MSDEYTPLTESELNKRKEEVSAYVRELMCRVSASRAICENDIQAYIATDTFRRNVMGNKE